MWTVVADSIAMVAQVCAVWFSCLFSFHRLAVLVKFNNNRKKQRKRDGGGGLKLWTIEGATHH